MIATGKEWNKGGENDTQIKGEERKSKREMERQTEKNIGTEMERVIDRVRK